MKVLVYGAGVTGSLLAADLHRAGHDVALLARGERLADLRRHGLRLAEGDSPTVRTVPVPVVSEPDQAYDLIAVLVRTHQIDEILEVLAAVEGDVLFMVNWAAGAGPLVAALGRSRVLLGFPTMGGTMDGDVVRYRAPSTLTRLMSIPIGEPDGAGTPRVRRLIAEFRAAGVRASAQPRMADWLRTHAAVGVPLGQAVLAAGGPQALADDPVAIRGMIHDMRRNLAATGPVVPRAFGALRVLPEAVLVPVLRNFLRGPTAVHSGLSSRSAATIGEYERLAEQLRRGY